MQVVARGGALVNVGLERRMPAPPGSPWGDSTPPTNGQIGFSSAGISVTEKSALGIPAVWACVNILADALATLPLRQYRGVGTDRKEVDPSPIVVDPWPDAGLTDLDFRAAGTMSLALRGNHFGQVVDRDRLGYPTMIRPIDPDHMRVARLKSGTVEYRDSGTIIPAGDVFHIRNIMRSGSLVGLNPIEELRVTLGLARASEMYAGAFYTNSANPGGVLETPEDLSEEETLALLRNWNANHQGIGMAQAPAVLTGGVTWKQISMNLEDAQFIESRQLTRSDIAMIFRVPPHMIGDVDRTTSWGTGIEQQELGFVRTTLAGYLRRWEVALSNCLPRGQYVRFDLRKRLRGDTLQRFQAWTLARNGGWMSPNEIRDEEDQGPIPDGDDYAKPLNMGNLGDPAGGIPNPMAPDPGAKKSPSS